MLSPDLTIDMIHKPYQDESVGRVSEVLSRALKKAPQVLLVFSAVANSFQYSSRAFVAKIMDSTCDEHESRG